MKKFLNIPLTITSPWGWRFHPINGEKHYHNGVDIKAVYEYIYAPEDGVIAYSHDGSTDKRSGKYLGLQISDGRVLEFVHLNEYYFKKGDIIKEGDLIAQTGNSGYSTAPHLHFGIKIWDSENNKYEAQDPTKYVKSLWNLKTAVLVGIPVLIMLGLMLFYFTK